MSVVCGAKCNKVVKSQSKGVNCDECGQWFHKTCGSIDDNMYKEMQEKMDSDNPKEWKCKDCSNKPVEIIENNNGNTNTELLYKMVRDMHEINEKVASDMAALIRKQQNEINGILEKVMEELDGRIKERVMKEIKPLAEAVKKLKYQNEVLLNKTIRNDIVLDNVPVFKDEGDARIFVMTVANYLGVELVNNDISTCRSLTRTKWLVTIINLTKRDSMMRRYHKLKEKKITFSDIWGESDNNTRIFLNDNTTITQVKLRKMAQKLKNEGRIIYYRFKNCMLNLEMANGEVAIIYDLDDLCAMYPEMDFTEITGTKKDSRERKRKETVNSTKVGAQRQLNNSKERQNINSNSNNDQVENKLSVSINKMIAQIQK